MIKRFYGLRVRPGKYPAALAVGGAFFFFAPPGYPIDAGDLVLRPSAEVGAAAGLVPAFRDDDGPDFRLRQSRQLAVAMGMEGRAAAYPDVAPVTTELSLQLAEALAPRFVSARTPVTARNDPPLELKPAPVFTAASGEPLLPVPETPSRRQQFPLRLAQSLAPRLNSAKQPRWSSRDDPPLGLQPADAIGEKNAPAGVGRTQSAAAGQSRPSDEARSRSAGADGAIPSPGGAPLLDDGGPAVAFEGGSSRGADADSAEAEKESEGSGWVIPPIRWMGTVGYILRQNSSFDESRSRSLDQLVTTNVMGSSFIYAPWFATVNGDIGLVTGVTSVQTGGAGATQSTRTQSSGIVGSASLDLFPVSRFPFGATFAHSDSRVSSTVTSSNSTTSRLGLRQNYRTEDGTQSLSGNFDTSVTTLQNGLKDTVTAFGGTYAAPYGPFSNNLNARYSISQREGSGEEASLFFVNTTHTLQGFEDEHFSLQAYSNFTDNSLRYNSAPTPGSGQSGGLSQSRGQYMQLSTAASWQPEFEDTDDLPLSLTGGLSYFGSKSGTEANSSQSQRLSAMTAANYRFSPNLSVNGTGALNQFSSNGAPSQMAASLGGGFGYSGDPLTFGNFSYNWNTGAGTAWSGGTGNTRSTVFSNAQAAHSLGRNFLLDTAGSLSLSVSQGLSAYKSQGAGSSSALSNSVSGNYSLALGERFNGSMSASFSDNMTSGATSQRYDSLLVSFNGMGQLTPRSSATVNLTFNWSDMTLPTTVQAASQTQTPGQPPQPSQPNSNQRMNLGGSASFTHQRFAGVPGLRYTFLFTADTKLRDDRLLGNVNASSQSERARYTVDNRLDFRLGLLDLRFSATMNDTGGKKNALLFFQATRQIGAY